MAAKIGQVVIDFLVNNAKFERDIKQASRTMQGFGRQMTQAGQALTKSVTVPLAGAAAASVKFATDFNKSMANVATLIPGNTARIQELKTNVQDMAIATGKSTDDLADGLYQVISAFQDSADTSKILEINAKAAAAGLATTTDAINLTSAVTKGYGEATAEAVAKAADLAFTTVRLGQTTFPELAASMGRVVPIAAQLNVSQEEMFAGFATLTGVTGNAAEVSTQLAAILRAMIKPTKDMSAGVAALGEKMGMGKDATAGMIIEQIGLTNTLKALIKQTDGTETSVGKLFGRAEALTSVFALTGSSAASMAGNFESMKLAAGGMDEAFGEYSEGVNKFGFSMDQLKQRFIVAAQRFGDALIPVLAKGMVVFEGLANLAMKLAEWFAQLPGPIQVAAIALGGLAAAAGPVMWMIGSLTTNIGAALPLFSKMAAWLPKLALGFKACALAMGPWGLAIAAVGAALIYFADDIANATVKVMEFLGVIEKTPETVTASDKAIKGFADRLKISEEFAKELSATLAESNVSLYRFSDTIKEYQKELEDGVITQEEYEQKLKALAKGSKEYTVKVQGLAKAFREGKISEEEYKKELKELGKLTPEATKKTGQYDKALEDLMRQLDGATGSQGKFNKTLAEAPLHYDTALEAAESAKESLKEFPGVLTSVNMALNDDVYAWWALQDAVEDFNENASSDIDGFQSTFEKDMQAIGAAMMDLSGPQTEAFLREWDEKHQEAGQTTNDFGKLVGDTLNRMTEHLFDKVRTWAGPFGDFAAAALEAVVKGFAEPFINLLTGLGNAVGNWLQSLIFGGGKGFQIPGINLGGGGGLFGGGGLLGTAIGGIGKLFGIGAATAPAATGGSFGGLAFSGMMEGLGLEAPGAAAGGGFFGPIGAAISKIGTGITTGLSAVGSAISAGMQGIWAGLGAAGPVGWIGALGAGGYFGVKALVDWASGPNAYEALKKEIARDYGGIDVPEEVIKTFLDTVGITEPEAWDIRKNISASPAFLLGVVGKFAEEQGKLDQFFKSLEKVQTSWGAFDFRKAFEEGLKTEDWSALNEMWLETSEIGKGAIQEVADNFSDLLIPVVEQVEQSQAAAADAIDHSTDSFKELNTVMQDLGLTVSELNNLLNEYLVKQSERLNIMAGQVVESAAAVNAALPAVPAPGVVGAASSPAAPNLTYTGGNINLVIQSTSEDLERVVRERVIPMLQEEMLGGPTGLRESIVKAYINTAGGY